MKAWQKDTEIIKNEEPCYLADDNEVFWEEQNEGPEQAQDILTKIHWHSNVPGSRASESICLAAPKDAKYHYTFTLAGYEDMFRVLQYVNSDEWYKKVSTDLPILLCSGWEDPVGNYGIGPAEVTEKLQDSGHNVNMVLYEGMRHEILNEIDKETVWEDMLGYILDMADGVCDIERGFDCQFE